MQTIHPQPRAPASPGVPLATLALLGLTPMLWAGTIDFGSHWDDTAPLANPHKGWYHHYPDNHINKYAIAHDADLLKFPGMDHLYIRLAWAYLEPEEGKFNWPIIDDLINKWTGHELGIAFRISCRETGTDRPEQQFATPRWVIEAGARGGHYLRGQATGLDGPWEPAFDDPIFLAKLENFLRAFAERYDGRPWLRYVDVGSIGDWGEGHTHSGSRKDYSFEVRKKHIDLHLKHFTNSQIVVTDDYVYALSDPEDRRRMHQYVLDQRISYRDDSILVNGYLSGTSDRFTVRSPEFFADAYPNTPTVLELEHYGGIKRLGNWDATPDSLVAKHGRGKKGPDYFRGALGLLHATYIGYHGYAHEWFADNPELTVELLNRCGYWYFLHRADLPETIQIGQAGSITLAWENRGVAPAYHAYCLLVRLEGPRQLDFALSSRNQRWLPDDRVREESYPLRLGRDAVPGPYTVKLKLWSPTAARDVLLALDRKLLDEDGFYRMGEITLRE